MNCMKCGREIALGQVFCKECLADMATYPIKPDTPVNLPPQTVTTPNRRSRPARKTRKPEEQVAILRRIVLGLVLVLLLVSLAFAVTTISLTQRICDHTETAPPGQNYSTMEDGNTTT